MLFDHLSFACDDQTEMGSLSASLDARTQRPIFIAWCYYRRLSRTPPTT
jgi:hypothetical protein